MNLLLVPLNNINIDVPKLISEFNTQEKELIDAFLKSSLLDYEENHLLNTKLLIDEESNQLVGFFSLSTTTVKLTSNYKKKHNVLRSGTFNVYPALNINYFAIDGSFQKNGIGRELMRMVFKIAIHVSDNLVGFNVLTLTSLDSALGFYKKIGFEEINSNSMRNDHQMLLTVDEIKEILA